MIEITKAAANRRQPRRTAQEPRSDAGTRTDFEEIRWRDSGMHLAAEEWTLITRLRARGVASGMEVVTVGTLVHEDDDVVILGLSIDEPGDAVFGAQVIWKPAILERRGLARRPDGAGAVPHPPG